MCLSSCCEPFFVVFGVAAASAAMHQGWSISRHRYVYTHLTSHCCVRGGEHSHSSAKEQQRTKAAA
jgi:hypothetical protein